MSDFEPSDTNWDDFWETLSTIVQTSFEAVLAEIIDNSIDAGATKIHIEIVGYNKDDFAVIVYDDGAGFRTKAEQKAGKPPSIKGLSEAFSLGGGEAMGGIGKFNIGLKITPLSKCDTVFAMCKLDDGKIIHRGLNKELMSINKSHGTFTTEPGTAATRVARKTLKSDSNPYRTAIILYDFKKMPIRNKPIITDYDKADLAKFLMAYFGLIYQNTLEKENAPLIYVHKEKEAFRTKPRDPFWADLTPKRIDYRLALPSSDPLHIKDEHRYLMQCFKEWGTVKTETQTFYIETTNKAGEPEKHPVKITGYVIPSNNLRGRLPDRYKQKELWSAPYKHNTSMKLVNLGGLYFYRDDRCICFGQSRTAGDNLGWYTLHEDPEGWLNKTRVKVEFGEGLDDWLAMSATKDSVDPEDEFFDKVLKALNQLIQEPPLRAGLGDDVPFYQVNGKKKGEFVAALAQSPTSATGKIRQNCNHCGDESPAKYKPWHHVDTKCPKAPCETCGEGCPGACEHECAHCPAVGDHHSSKCPNNCPLCEYPIGAGGHAEGETCPSLCGGCSKSKVLCECECPRGCGGTVSICTCCQTCLKGDCECPEDEKKSRVIHKTDEKIAVELVKGSDNIDEVVEEAKKHLGL